MEAVEACKSLLRLSDMVGGVALRLRVVMTAVIKYYIFVHEKPSTTTMDSFRLLDLPTEVVLQITRAIDSRSSSTSSFPSNPHVQLLRFRATSFTFYKLLHTTLWQSRYFAFSPDYQEDESSDEQGGNPARRRRKRQSLRTFTRILKSSDALMANGGRTLPIFIPQINMYRVGQTGFKGEDSQELTACVELIERFAPHLTCAFFLELSLAKVAGDKLIAILHASPSLKTLRFNQCDIGPLRNLDLLSPFPALKALHVRRSITGLILY